MDYGGSSRPAPVLVGIMILMFVCIAVGNQFGVFPSMETTAVSPPSASDPSMLIFETPMPATPIAPTMDATQIQQKVEAAVTETVAALRIEQQRAEAVATITHGQQVQLQISATNVMLDTTRVANETAQKANERTAAETLAMTRMGYAILIVGAAAASGVFMILLGLVIRKLMAARQQQDEAAARKLEAERQRDEAAAVLMAARQRKEEATRQRVMAQANLVTKDTTPLRDHEKSHEDAETPGNPHPKGNNPPKDHDRTTKGHEEGPPKAEKQFKSKWDEIE